MSFIMPGFWYTLRVLLHQVFIVQSLKSWVWLWLFRGKTGTNVQFIHLHSCIAKAGRSIHWLCALQLHNAFAALLYLTNLCDFGAFMWHFSINTKRSALMGILQGSFWSCSKHSQHMFYHYIGNCCEQTPLGEWKRFPCLELATYRNIKIQNSYESWEKKGFLKAAVNRAVRLWECPSGRVLCA